MNTLLLALLATCPPGGDSVLPQAPAPGLAYPDAGPAPGCSSRQGHARLFGWLRGHAHHSKCPCAGNGRAAADPTPVEAAPAVAGATVPVVESVPPQPPLGLAPAPGAPPLAPADGAPGPSEPVTSGAAPPRIVPIPTPPAGADDAPRRMPRGNQ
jgi:hypothetical protein